MLEPSAPALAASEAVIPLPPRLICSLASPAPGRDLPGPGKRRGNILWNGPNSWLVQGEAPAALAARTGGVVTEQSDGLFLFAIGGARPREILKRLVPIDLREDHFAPDSCAITHAAHIGVRLWREEDAFILACFRSFAGALHHALRQAEAGCFRAAAPVTDFPAVSLSARPAPR